MHRTPRIRQGDRIQILDTSHDLMVFPITVNDCACTIIQGPDGVWHLYGIYHADPFGPDQEFEFIHAIHEGPLYLPDHAQFKKVGIALTRMPELGETHIWAPHGG